MTALQPAQFGQITGLSQGDIDAIASMYYDIPSTRRKPNFPAGPLPQLVFPQECTFTAPPPTPPLPPVPIATRCAAWRIELSELDVDLIPSAVGINERKKLLSRRGQLVGLLDRYRCAAV